MALIANFVQAVRSAIYGEEVRGSIADALNAMNNESENALKKAHTAQVLSESTREVAAQANTKSDAAVTNSANAVRDSSNALTSATEANEVAKGIEWKAVQALNIATECKRLNSDARDDASTALRMVTELKQIVDNFGDYYIKLPIYDANGDPLLDEDGNQITGLVRVLTR